MWNKHLLTEILITLKAVTHRTRFFPSGPFVYLFFLNCCFGYQYFHTRSKHYAEKKRCVLFPETRLIFWAVEGRINTSTNHVEWNASQRNTTTNPERHNSTAQHRCLPTLPRIFIWFFRHAPVFNGHIINTLNDIFYVDYVVHLEYKSLWTSCHHGNDDIFKQLYL